MEARGLDDAHLAVAVKRNPSTIYRWRKTGIDFVSWIGLLNLIGLPATWEPGQPVAKLPAEWKPGDPLPSTSKRQAQ